MTIAFKALQCPQCSGALPRVALWKWVECPWCHTTVTLGEETVRRKDFLDAWLRLCELQRNARSGRQLQTDTHTYSRVHSIFTRTGLEVCAADRETTYPQRVVLHVASDAVTSARLLRSWSVHQHFQADSGTSAAMLRLRMPRAWALESDSTQHRSVLVSHYPRLFEGTLADVLVAAPSGIDAGHAVWLWRRVLGALRYLHECGWVHAQVAPEHVLINSRDHLCLLLGWSQARTDASARARAHDLSQAAWCIRAALAGNVDVEPPVRCSGALGALLQRCCDDTAWLATQSAAALDVQIVTAAQSDFGPPKFVPFNVFSRT